MTGKTHVAAGIAASIAVTQPADLKGCLIAVMGGAIGGAVCDIDTIKNRYGINAVTGQSIALSISAAVLLIDVVFHTGIVREVLARDSELLTYGVSALAVLGVCGFFTPHRSFTHSITALVLFSWAVSLIYPPVTVAFIGGFVSHMVLDMMNKREVRLLFPLKWGFCTGWFRADKQADKWFRSAAVVLGTMLMFRSWIYPHLSTFLNSHL